MPFDIGNYLPEKNTFVSHRFVSRRSRNRSNSTSVFRGIIDISPRIIYLNGERKELSYKLFIPYFDCENRDELCAHSNEREGKIRKLETSRWKFIQYIDKDINTEDPSYGMMLEEARIACDNGLEKHLEIEFNEYDDSKSFSIPDNLQELYDTSEITYLSKLL